MNILHYTLGFPPYRSGGLTKYAQDLMLTQIELGHHVFALYPGDISILRRKAFIEKDKDIQGIKVFELKNPLPVPLLYGETDSKAFTNGERLDLENFKKFLNVIRPDIFHIHTLMGMPYSILEIVHEKGIKIVYTTHDYFGLCPKVNFIDNEGYLCNKASEKKCLLCNQNAPSVFYLRIRNSKIIVFIKKIISFLNK